VKLKNLSVQYYSGFDKPQKLDFAIPNGKPSSGLTLIMGENNSGKTSIVDIFMYLTSQEQESFKDLLKSFSTKDSTKFTIIYNNLNGKEYEQIVSYNPLLNSISVTPKSDKREVNFAMFGGRYSKINNDDTTNKKSQCHGINEESPLKKQIDKLNEKNLLEECKKLVKKIFPNCDDFELYNDEVRLVKNNGLNHKIHLGGSGVKKVILICAALILNKQDILILDEPEQSLHPKMLKNLSKVLSEETKGRQIIVITHSPYLVNWQDLLNGASFVRTNITKKGCTINNLILTTEFQKLIYNNIYGLRGHILFSLKANELFFYDNVLLVEGQEDFSLLQNWLNAVYNDQPFEIFGYGVGGVDNIPTFLEITRNLGFGRVAVLTDKIDSSHEDRIKKWENQNLDWSSDATKYLRLSLKTKDIRDKPAEGIIGYFDINWKIKEEYEPHLKEIFDRLSLFFNQERT
jgi:predicted ATP-dependent endonuclease of OLD family